MHVKGQDSFGCGTGFFSTQRRAGESLNLKGGHLGQDLNLLRSLKKTETTTERLKALKF